MKRRLIDFWNQQNKSRQRGLAIGGVILVVVLFFAIKAALPDGGSSTVASSEGQPIGKVQRGPLSINIVESGAIRPREQIVIRNELEDAATILYIVDEGTLVKKGDLLVELDVTQLENDVVERRIRVQNDEADLVAAQENKKVVENQAQADIQQAELDYQFAQQDLKKYLEGEYPNLLNKAEANITLARQSLSQAQEDLKWSQTLFEEKYISQSELQQDELAAKRAELDLQTAISDRDLLKQYTYQRQVDELKSNVNQTKMALERTKRMANANVAQAKATLAAREAELKEESSRLEEMEAALKKAKMYAPIDGMVLYATSVEDRWRRDDETIEVGTTIRERDEIIYLPTASEFNVEVKINEVDLSKVEVGLPVKITVDAIPDQVFTGKVANLAQLPDQESRAMNPNLKLYKTVVELDPGQTRLRNGMSCRAEIQVEQYQDVLYVPIQAVVRLDGQPTVYVAQANGEAVPQPVEIGLDNSRFVHIKNGLKEGQRILLAPPLKSGSEEEKGQQPQGETPEEESPGQEQPETPPVNQPEMQET